MMSWLRCGFTLARVTLHLLLALAIVGLLFPFWSGPRRRVLIRWWSHRVLNIFGIRLVVIPPAAGAAAARIDRILRPEGDGAMFVMNHVSWLDVYVVHAVRPARFIAKSEIGGWPLVGYLTTATGAIYIERGRRHAVREVNHKAAAMLRDGDLLGMFPEGTTSDGFRLLPFHANLIQPAIDAGAPIVVAGLRYRERDGRPTTATSYIGDTSLLESIVHIARHGPLVAELHLIDAIDGRGVTRHAAARTARALIAETLDFDDEAEETAEGLSSVMIVPDDVAVSLVAAPAGKRPGTAPDPRDELL